MKANHIPVTERLQNRIGKLSNRLGEAFKKSPSPGNPYHACTGCGIHTPSFYINGERHFKRCRYQGLDKEIAYYSSLLEDLKINSNSGDILSRVVV